MGDTTKLVAGIAEVPLGKVTLFMSPLNDVDIAELNEYVRARYIANADQAARASDLNDARWKLMVMLAMDRAMGMTWYEPPGSMLMATIDGVVRLAWQCCKKNMPDLTYEKLRERLVDPRNLAIFRERFARHNAVPRERTVKSGKASRPTQKTSGTPRSRKRRATPTRK